MSIRNTISFRCPACDKTFPITQWVTILPTEDPPLRARAMNGDLFHCTCPHCGKHMMVAYNCLYRDLDKRFAVSLHANRNLSAVAPLLPGYQMRLEYTLSAFVERLRILDAGLDDMAFELFRSLLLVQVRRQYPGRTINSLRFETIERDSLYLQLSQTDQIKLPLSAYRSIRDKVKVSGFQPKVGGYLHIHGLWVKQSGILDAISNSN